MPFSDIIGNMVAISSRIKEENFKVEIKSPTGNVVIADEPLSMGGKNLGFSPKELLASALAACTSATVKMYADRKIWNLKEVKLNIELDYIANENKTIVESKIEFIGNLDDVQKERLLAVANACPVHKILSKPVEINTQLIK